MEGDIATRIKAFRRNVTPYLISREDFLDWTEIDSALVSWKAAATAIDNWLAEGRVAPKRLADLLGSVPQSYRVILTLIAFNTSDAQVDKWGVPPTVPTEQRQRIELASLLIEIGIGRIFSKEARTLDLLRIAEINRDSFRRRFRSTDRLSTRVTQIVRQQVTHFREETQQEIGIDRVQMADPQLKRSTAHILSIDDKPIAAVASVFQNQSGGRQQRDLTSTYPLLQERLAARGIALILVADGQGLREASDNSLRQLFEKVRYPMSLIEAEGGSFRGALADLIERPVQSELDEAAIYRMIDETLQTQEEIAAADLPISNDYAQLSFARYAASNPTLALRTNLDRSKLSWSRAGLVRAARNLRSEFQRDAALTTFQELVGSLGSNAIEGDRIKFSSFEIEENEFLPEKFFITSFFESDHIEAIKPVVDALMPLNEDARFVFNLIPNSVPSYELEKLRARQVINPINVIFVSPAVLERMAKATESRRVLVSEMLKQSDLTKASPFILSNATPSRMFFGRDAEAATMLATLSSNSVALLGSRRIGKTSLLRRVGAMLVEAGSAPIFIDCQTVRTWADFGEALERSAGIESEEKFRAPMLYNVVDELAKARGALPVLLMDEVDQLIQWDTQQRDEDSVPEAFFRTCRAISQEGRAQFVFSGERTIANKIWDPESPHWNFCRSIELRQIRRESTEELFFAPLRAMNVNFERAPDIGAALWERTSGHPQIAQRIGDDVVKLLDRRDEREVLLVTPADLDSATNNYDFAEHYLTTYWGQATPNEKIVSLVIAEGDCTASEMADRLAQIVGKPFDLGAALRILKLYGVIEGEGDQFSIRASWFPEALEHFGGSEAVLNRLLET